METTWGPEFKEVQKCVSSKMGVLNGIDGIGK